MNDNQTQFPQTEVEVSNDNKCTNAKTQSEISPQDTNSQFGNKHHHIKQVSNENITIPYENQNTANTYPTTVENMFLRTNSKSDTQKQSLIKNKHPKQRKKFHFQYYGNVILIYYTIELTEYDEPLIVIGPQWYVFLFGFGVFVAFELFIYAVLWEKANGLFYCVGCVIDVAQVGVYLLLFLKNPGIVVRKACKGESMCRLCKCVRYDNRNQRHCKICDACFVGLDHHCPWTSKCVGYKNVMLFRGFLGLTMLMFVWLVVIIISSN